MLGTRDSPIHRSDDLLCGHLSVTSESVDCFGSSPAPQTPDTMNPDEPDSEPIIIAAMAPVQAPGWNFQMLRPMDQMQAEYLAGYAAPPPVWISPSPPQLQFPCCYPTEGLVKIPDDSATVTSQDFNTAMDFDGMLYEPTVTHQPPPVPPHTPEPPTPPHPPPFYFHPCRWLSGPPCDGFAPGKNREMGEHLRVFHRFIGHERDTVRCDWENCGQSMQRMNVPRHIVSRHLLAAARCHYCSKRFSRPDVVSRHERTCGGGVLPLRTDRIGGV